MCEWDFSCYVARLLAKTLVNYWLVFVNTINLQIQIYKYMSQVEKYQNSCLKYIILDPFKVYEQNY